MIKSSADDCERISVVPSNVSPTSLSSSSAILPTGPPHAIPSSYQFVNHNKASSTQYLNYLTESKTTLNFLDHTSPRSYFGLMETQKEQWTMPKSTEFTDISGWPTVVDSRIPFTTYLQNLTRTLRIAAAKGLTSHPAFDNSTKLQLSRTTLTSPSTHHPRSSPPAYNLPSSPRSQSCGSQAEPDSSSCGDEKRTEPKEYDENVETNSEKNDCEINVTGNKHLEKIMSHNSKCRPSISSEGDDIGIVKQNALLITNRQPLKNKPLSGLVLPPAEGNFGEGYHGSLSAPVLPFSTLPASPMPSLSASFSYGYRPNLHHSFLENGISDIGQEKQHHHLCHGQQQLPQSSQSPINEKSVLSTSLPASLLHYHLQEQQYKRHQQQRQQHFQQICHQHEMRTHPCSDPTQSGRVFVESTYFQPLSINASSSSSKSPGQDVMFTKMLLDSRSHPGTSLMTTDTPPDMPLSGARRFSALTTEVGSFLNTSFLGLSGLNMRRSHVDKPAPVKKYKCDVCQKAFSRSNTLVTHKRIHTGDKPFKCEVCGRAFRQPGNLTRHRLTHTTHKPYVCQVCNKAFNRASNLNTHIRTHTNFRQFPCPAGAKTFPQKGDLTSHVFSHTGHGERLVGFPH